MRIVKQAKILYILTALFFCVAGITLLVYPTISAEIFCYITGGVLIFYGITKIIGYFSNDMYHLAFHFALALGIFFTLLGIILVLHPNVILTILPFLIGLHILVDGVFKLQTSIDAKRFGLPKWWLILLGALICILLGGILIFKPFEGAAALMMLMGFSLLADGIQHLFNAFYTVKILPR